MCRKESYLLVRERAMELYKLANSILERYHDVTCPYEGKIKRRILPEVISHSRRVSLRAYSLAIIHGINRNEAELIRISGLLHDIGKVVTPPEIIQAPRRLTAEEEKIINRHPVDGYKIVRKNKFPKQVYRIVRSHHEKWAGGGYPDNLQQDEVELEPNIVSLVDVFDSLVTKRSYKEAWSNERAFRYIDSNFGVLFRPELRRTFHIWYQQETGERVPLILPFFSFPERARYVASASS